MIINGEGVVTAWSKDPNRKLEVGSLVGSTITVSEQWEPVSTGGTQHTPVHTYTPVPSQTGRQAHRYAERGDRKTERQTNMKAGRHAASRRAQEQEASNRKTNIRAICDAILSLVVVFHRARVRSG